MPDNQTTERGAAAPVPIARQRRRPEAGLRTQVLAVSLTLVALSIAVRTTLARRWPLAALALACHLLTARPDGLGSTTEGS